MTKMDWSRSRRRKSSRPHVAGISNGQARELARLQRNAGLPYTGAGAPRRNRLALPHRHRHAEPSMDAESGGSHGSRAPRRGV